MHNLSNLSLSGLSKYVCTSLQSNLSLSIISLTLSTYTSHSSLSLSSIYLNILEIHHFWISGSSILWKFCISRNTEIKKNQKFQKFENHVCLWTSINHSVYLYLCLPLYLYLSCRIIGNNDAIGSLALKGPMSQNAIMTFKCCHTRIPVVLHDRNIGSKYMWILRN